MVGGGLVGWALSLVALGGKVLCVGTCMCVGGLQVI